MTSETGIGVEPSADPKCIGLRVNGFGVEVSVEPRRLLSDVLREELGLTGTHVACEHGVCGPSEIPTIEVHHLPTSGDDEVGYRGIREGGLIVAPATLVNAIEDALSPFGAVIEGQYLPPWRILELAGRC